MEIYYVRDLPPTLGRRLRGRGHWLHWLHPSQGPLPDILGELRTSDPEGLFTGAGWKRDDVIVTAIEAKSSDWDVPCGSPILRTYLWRLIDGIYRCGEIEVQAPLPADHDTLMEILSMSVWLDVFTKAGEIMRGSQLQSRRSR